MPACLIEMLQLLLLLLLLLLLASHKAAMLPLQRRTQPRHDYRCPLRRCPAHAVLRAAAQLLLLHNRSGLMVLQPVCLQMLLHYVTAAAAALLTAV
jgi:hypothetical protein